MLFEYSPKDSFGRNFATAFAHSHQIDRGKDKSLAFSSIAYVALTDTWVWQEVFKFLFRHPISCTIHGSHLPIKGATLKDLPLLFFE